MFFDNQLTSPAQKIWLGHHACLGGNGTWLGSSAADDDALATAVETVMLGMPVLLTTDVIVVGVPELDWALARRARSGRDHQTERMADAGDIDERTRVESRRAQPEILPAFPSNSL
jgi:hypothetical protein